jgi:hypothetical protein
MNDAILVACVVGVFCLFLALLAAIADWDEDRRDARRRNR